MTFVIEKIPSNHQISSNVSLLFFVFFLKFLSKILHAVVGLLTRGFVGAQCFFPQRVDSFFLHHGLPSERSGQALLLHRPAHSTHHPGVRPGLLPPRGHPPRQLQRRLPRRPPSQPQRHHRFPLCWGSPQVPAAADGDPVWAGPVPAETARMRAPGRETIPGIVRGQHNHSCH